MTFGVPQWLWGLLLIPLLIALFVRSERRGLKRLQEFVSTRLLPQLRWNGESAATDDKVCAAAARPRFGHGQSGPAALGLHV